MLKCVLYIMMAAAFSFAPPAQLGIETIWRKLDIQRLPKPVGVFLALYSLKFTESSTFSEFYITLHPKSGYVNALASKRVLFFRERLKSLNAQEILTSLGPWRRSHWPRGSHLSPWGQTKDDRRWRSNRRGKEKKIFKRGTWGSLIPVRIGTNDSCREVLNPQHLVIRIWPKTNALRKSPWKIQNGWLAPLNLI